MDGVTSFDPADFVERDKLESKMLLSEFTVYDGESGEQQNRIRAARSFQEIDLAPSYRYLNLKFAFPNYEDDYLNKYAWKIDGLDKDWQIQKENKLQLGRLPYGTHYLNVKGANSNGGWSNSQLKIKLNVLKPFYLQSWFLAGVIVLSVISLIAFFRYKTNELKANEILLQQKVNEATETIQNDKELIQQQADDLQEMDRVKSRFFTNVSHELGTPLTLILGPIEQLLNSQSKDVDEKTKTLLGLSLSNSKKLKNRVDELLDLAKMDSDKLVLNEIPVHLDTLFSNTINAFRPLLKKQDVALEIENKIDKNTNVFLDESKFVKVLDNLMSNAVKYAPAGSSIFAILEATQDGYKVSVADQGEGVSLEDQKQLFERYYQTKSGVASGGTGIGLAFSQGLARLMGGDLVFNAKYTDGASFVFSFKAAESQKSAKSLSNMVNEELGKLESSNQQDKLKILIVEDNEEMRLFIKSTISDDFDVVEAMNGKEGLAILQRTTIDLILSDIMMPVMDGISFVTELKKSKFDEIPVIMLSAKSKQEDIVALLEMGVDDYVVKPFYARELLARLHNQAKNLRVRREAKSQIGLDGDESYTDKWMNELRNFILENIENSNFGVSDVASNMNTTERTLNRKLNKHIGLSTASYIKEMRLQKALGYLSSKTYSTVKEVSFAVGFKRQDYFAKEFYKRYGKYPKEY